jgi:hypothetical protein
MGGIHGGERAKGEIECPPGFSGISHEKSQKGTGKRREILPRSSQSTRRDGEGKRTERQNEQNGGGIYGKKDGESLPQKTQKAEKAGEFYPRISAWLGQVRDRT